MSGPRRKKPKSRKPGAAKSTGPSKDEIRANAPVNSYRMLRAAWIMARAFTPNRFLAIIGVPWTIMSVLPKTLRGGLYLDETRTGTVMFARLNSVFDFLISGTYAFLYGIFQAGVAAGLAAVVGGQLGVAVQMAWIALAFGAVFFLTPKRGAAMTSFGPESPQGERWEVTGLAQLPGTSLTAVQLALRLIDTPAKGAIVGAVADTPELEQAYRRLGFTAGDRRRVHRTVK